MAVVDDRYSREIRRYALAMRLIDHNARTETIHSWTSLPRYRIRNLRHLHTNNSGQNRPAHLRGPKPTNLRRFLISTKMRQEVAALGALFRMLRVLPTRKVVNARLELPSLTRGERLCLAFEMFHALIAESSITFEQALLLVTALAQGREIEMGQCTECGGTIVVDRLGTVRRSCRYCRGRILLEEETETRPHLYVPPDIQQSLF